LTTVAVVSILWPLAKSPGVQKARDTSRALYFAQLAEITRDEAQNWVSAADAQAARDEAARRLMARAEAEERQRKSMAPPGKRGFLAAMAVLLLVPGFSVILYSRIGHPDWPDAPLSARLSAPPSETDMAAAIAKIEAHLAEHPEDGRGYEVLAPVYLRLGRSEDAVHAASEALRLLGPNAQRLTLYGETLIAAADGEVSPQARQAFEAASDTEPQAIKPRFFLGLAAEQAGDTARAKEIWEKLIAEAPPDAPWARMLRQRIATFDNTPPKNPPPEADSKAAAVAALPQADQMKAIRGMVEGLAERLAKNGQDLEGWLRLVRSYVVLKDADKAQAALSDAKRNLAADPQAIARLDALAKELGLKGSS
ncbi:MAG: c-type cytochrome biogenesis protein CcmI, partial [Alphaproteobacteria bacterium]|nr:c-type cytochrome biogenesis protein CcmI [Alphaproteobacteria bacterium]